jgi:hypothetical protein
LATVETTGGGWALALAFACCPGALLNPTPLPFGTLEEVGGNEERAGDGLAGESGGEEEDGDCGCGADPWPPVNGGGGSSV